MQIDLMPYLPPSGDYRNIIAANNIFSRLFSFCQTSTDASATNTPNVLIAKTTKHISLITTLITDKGIEDLGQNSADFGYSNQHPQTIGKLVMTHANLPTKLKKAAGSTQFQHEVSHESRMRIFRNLSQEGTL